MAAYLEMNGTNDYIKTPSLTFTDVYLDMLAEPSTSVINYYIDARIGIGLAFVQSLANGTDSYSVFNSIYVDGVLKTNNTTIIPRNQRCLLRVSKNTSGTDDVNIFSSNNPSNYMKGKIWSVKFYNGASLVAHYDMTTGTVQDQSGNGNHATLFGGTWVTPTPAFKVSDGTNFSNVSLSNIKRWNGSSFVNVNGVKSWDGNQWKSIL